MRDINLVYAILALFVAMMAVLVICLRKYTLRQRLLMEKIETLQAKIMVLDDRISYVNETVNDIAHGIRMLKL